MGLIYSPATPNEYEQKHLSWRGDERKKILRKIKGKGVNAGVGGGRKKLKNRIYIMSKRKGLKALCS